MAQVEELGIKIAERELEFFHEDGGISHVIVRIGLPVPVDGNGDYCCPYEISAENRTKLRGVIGIDSLQALQLTLATLKVEIEGWEKKEDGKFRFLGEPGYGL